MWWSWWSWWWMAAVAAAPAGESLSEAVVGPPIELIELRAGLLSGDLVAFERARALFVEQGGDGTIGEAALLADLSRLARCLPIGPIPSRESRRYRALRTLVRLERVRLESVMRDAIYRDSSLIHLLGEPPLFDARVVDRQRSAVVRWPIEQELWPGEVVDPIPEVAKCASKPGALAESNPKQREAHARERARVIREHIAAALALAEVLPAEAAARVAFVYLVDASAAGLRLPSEWRAKIGAAIRGGAQPIRSAGLILLGRMNELMNDLDGARVVYREVLRDSSRTDEEDSRARARLVGLEEPSFEMVLAIARSTERAARDEDRVVFANAEARALYALGRWSELEAFGRVWLRTDPGEDPFEEMTRDLLLRVGLQLEPAEAMAWALELGENEPSARIARLDALGKLAVESGSLELATAVYDRLRIESAAARSKIGPGAAADEARWIAERALIELLEDDVEGFGGLIDDLVELARVERDRPLARNAPHRELARLCQNALGRLANEVAERPERRRFAALLLEGAIALTREPGRWRAVLEDFIPALELLAGPYAVGRDRAAVRAAPAKKKDRKVRLLGEVIVPRLPPRLEAPDYPTELPAIDSFLVYPQLDGSLVTGAFWKPRSPSSPAK